MEPISAAWIVAILAENAAKMAAPAVGSAVEKAGEVAGDAVRALVAAIRRHFGRDAGATDALDRLDEAPDDVRRRGAVEERIEEAMGRDSEFAETLTRLAEQIRATRDQSVVVRDSGAVAVQGDVNIRAGGHAAGRDITLEGVTESATSHTPGGRK